MRIRMLIGALALAALVTGNPRQTAAQKNPKNPGRSSEDIKKNLATSIARIELRDAVIRDMVETWEKCEDELNRGDGKMPSCDTYDAKIRQTPIDTLVFTVLLPRLSTEDTDQLKYDIVGAAIAAYKHGKQKGSAK